MSAHSSSPIATFLDTWVPEFIKSVEMFTGQAVALEARDVTPASSDLLWHEQALKRSGTEARIWLGVPIAACGALTAGAADDEASGVQLFREIIDQSVKATAQVLNTGDCRGLQCAESFGTEAPASDVPSASACWFRPGTGEPVPVLVRYERPLETLLAGEKPEAPASLTTVPMAAAETPGEVPPVFERFVGVELPVSVVLGRANLRVRDVLKLTVGSLVELDRRPSDPVDVCVHDVVVARGEVVSIRGNYGVRVVEVMSQRDRFELQGRSRGLGRLSANGEPASRTSVH